ncbi:hypothetical protein RFI_39846, partial [Reticulomyxa filosa]
MSAIKISQSTRVQKIDDGKKKPKPNEFSMFGASVFELFLKLTQGKFTSKDEQKQPMAESGTNTTQYTTKRISQSQSQAQSQAQTQTQSPIQTENIQGLDESLEEEEEETKATPHNVRRQSRATIRNVDTPDSLRGNQTPQSLWGSKFGNDGKQGPKRVSDLNEALSQIHMIISGEQERGAKPYQEDSTCIFYSPDLSVIMGAIFDGHGGLNGQIASSRAAKMTHDYFEN